MELQKYAIRRIKSHYRNKNNTLPLSNRIFEHQFLEHKHIRTLKTLQIGKYNFGYYKIMLNFLNIIVRVYV